MNKVAVFIDGSNFFHSLKSIFKYTKIDFYKLSTELCKKVEGKLIRTYYYNVPLDQSDNPEEYAKQQKFFENLKRTPFLDLKLGRIEERNGTKIEKGVDVNIAVDMIMMAHRNIYDSAILISGDGDFVPVLKAIRDNFSKHIYVANPHKKCYHLKTEADKFILIDKDIFDKVKF